MHPICIEPKKTKRIIFTIILACTVAYTTGCAESEKILHKPTDPRAEGFVQTHSLDEFPSIPSGTINGTLAPLISASTWNRDEDTLMAPEEVNWESLPFVQEDVPLIIDSPFPPNEVWITRLETAVDQSLSQENSMAEPVLCSQDNQEVCQVSIKTSTTTQIKPSGNISSYGRYRFMTIQAIWFTPTGDESVSWATQIAR